MANKEANLVNRVVLPGPQMQGLPQYAMVLQSPASIQRARQCLERPVPNRTPPRVDPEKPRVVHASFQGHSMSPHNPNEYEL